MYVYCVLFISVSRRKSVEDFSHMLRASNIICCDASLHRDRTFTTNKESNMESQENLIKKLVAKAEADSDFRARLVSNPGSALKETFDIDMPEDFNVVVHEDDARTAHLVLPASAELSDAQLQQAAGGAWCGEPQWY